MLTGALKRVPLKGSERVLGIQGTFASKPLLGYTRIKYQITI